MEMLFVILLSCIAGLISGSFAAPSKLMKKWPEETTWLVFSIFGFIIFPLGYVCLVTNGLLFKVLSEIPTGCLAILIAGGLSFGIGQVAQCVAFKLAGIGITFIINISISTAGTAVIPLLWNREYIGTTYCYLQLAGSLLFVFAVILGGMSGFERDSAKNDITKKSERKLLHIVIGIILAIVAGLGTAAEGLTYAYANPIASQVGEKIFALKPMASTNIAWSVIFGMGWFPFLAYYLIVNLKNKTMAKCLTIEPLKYWPCAVLIGIFYWFPLVIFSKASNIIGSSLGPTIAWPLFMTFIIFSSNIWSFILGEWKNAPKKAVLKSFASVLIFVLAIIIFSASSRTLNN